MLERHRCREIDNGWLRSRDGETLLNLRLQFRQIIARMFGALVERVMFAAVDGFLRRKCFDFSGELWRSALAKLSHAFDEICLADGKGGRQGVVDSSRFDAPAVP